MLISFHTKSTDLDIAHMVTSHLAIDIGAIKCSGYCMNFRSGTESGTPVVIWEKPIAVPCGDNRTCYERDTNAVREMELQILYECIYF